MSDTIPVVQVEPPLYIENGDEVWVGIESGQMLIGRVIDLTEERSGRLAGSWGKDREMRVRFVGAWSEWEVIG